MFDSFTLPQIATSFCNFRPSTSSLQPSQSSVHHRSDKKILQTATKFESVLLLQISCDCCYCGISFYQRILQLSENQREKRKELQKETVAYFPCSFIRISSTSTPPKIAEHSTKNYIQKVKI